MKYSSPYELGYATEGAAGIDLYWHSHELVTSSWGGAVLAMVNTKTRVEIPYAHFGMVTLRSSFAKMGFRMNAPGIIDSDYRGEIYVPVWHEAGIHTLKLDKLIGRRVFQLIIIPHAYVPLKRVEKIDSDTQRGEGGFGSTGTM